MSYQFELPRVPGADIVQALRERGEVWASRATMTDEEYDAFTEHLEGTAHAAEALISWMSPGPGKEPDVRAVVSGHANPGHLPREGYSDEHITISIGVLPAENLSSMGPPVEMLATDPEMVES